MLCLNKSTPPLLPLRCSPTRAMASSFLRFLDHTQRRITVGKTSLDEWSARRREIYLPTYNSQHKHLCPGGIRTHNLSKRAVVDRRLRPRGHWDRRLNILLYHIENYLLWLLQSHVPHGIASGQIPAHIFLLQVGRGITFVAWIRIVPGSQLSHKIIPT